MACVISSITTYYGTYYRKSIIIEETQDRQQSKRWKELLLLLSEPVIVFNSTKILFKNPAMYTLINQTVADDEHFFEAINAYLQLHTLRNTVNEIHKNKGISQLVEENIIGEFAMVLNETDTDVKCSINLQKIFFKGEDAMLALFRPTSDIENLHRKLIEDKYRGVLLSTITHEIKTPLTIIKGNIETLKDYVSLKGMTHFNAMKISITFLEYFMHDITVFLFYYSHTLKRI